MSISLNMRKLVTGRYCRVSSDEEQLSGITENISVKKGQIPFFFFLSVQVYLCTVQNKQTIA